MHDQADELRQLVFAAAHQTAAAPGPRPRLIVLAGGKGGVGASTIALNLSVSLALQGRRVVLVDADLRRGDLAPMCGLNERHHIGDVLAGRRSIHEVLQPGPAGIQILPGAWAPAGSFDISPMAQQRLLKQIGSLHRHAEIVVLDAGSGAGPVARSYWLAADEVLLVTLPDALSIMDSYATIKLVLDGQYEANIRTLVNRAEAADAAEDVHQRLAVSCRRFLGIEIADAGYVLDDPQVAAAVRSQLPVVLQEASSPASLCIDRLAQQIEPASVARAA